MILKLLRQFVTPLIIIGLNLFNLLINNLIFILFKLFNIINQRLKKSKLNFQNKLNIFQMLLNKLIVLIKQNVNKFKFFFYQNTKNKIAIALFVLMIAFLILFAF